MAYPNPHARFKVWMLGTNGQIDVKKGYPYKSEVQELAKLKDMMLNWRLFPIEKAIFYDLRRMNDQGEPIEIGRYENQRFIWTA